MKRSKSEGIASRRQVLRLGLAGSAGLALAACLPDVLTPTPTPVSTPRPEPTPTLRLGPKVIMQRVLDYKLTSDEWPGEFGSVTIRLSEAIHDGQSVYYFWSDTSDEIFAIDHGLVWAPLLLGGEEDSISNTLYVFNDPRPAIMRSIPGDRDYLSLFEIVGIDGPEDAFGLISADEVRGAAEAGMIKLRRPNIFVNAPVIKWPDGELPVDEDRTSYLGTGQLLAPIDTEAMTATFKLHEGYPGDRYIVTHTSALDRVDEMHIAPAAAAWPLVEHNAVDEVFVFANGIPGPGVMGYQPAVFGSAVDSLVWSPFWNHFTVEWVHEDLARILRNADEVYDAIDRGELVKYNGVPDSHPDGFVVNCPIPVLADNVAR